MPAEIRPQYRSKTSGQALGHLVEEMGEALAAAGKTFRWGPHSVNPELPPEQQEQNIDWLARECEDVKRAIDEFFVLYAKEQASDRVRTAPAETSGLITEQNKSTSANAGEK